MAFYDDIHTTKRFRLGTRKRDVAGREFIYLQGVGSTVATDAVVYDEDGVTARATTSTNGPMAVAMAAVDATTEYGWYGIWGEFTVDAAGVSDNGIAYATTTAGRLDDAANSTSRVHGAIFRSDDNSGATSATIQITYPFIGPDLSA